MKRCYMFPNHDLCWPINPHPLRWQPGDSTVGRRSRCYMALASACPRLVTVTGAHHMGNTWRECRDLGKIYTTHTEYNRQRIQLWLRSVCVDVLWQHSTRQSEAILEYPCSLTWVLTWIFYGNPAVTAACVVAQPMMLWSQFSHVRKCELFPGTAKVYQYCLKS